MSTPPAAGAPLARILDALEQDPKLVPETTIAIRETLPGYDEVPAASLEASIHRNIALSIRTLRSAAAPDATQIHEAEELALERMGQGVPLGSVLAGFRLCMTVIPGRLQQLAPAHGLSAEEVLSGATLRRPTARSPATARAMTRACGRSPLRGGTTASTSADASRTGPSAPGSRR